jgi:hypothetical protein
MGVIYDKYTVLKHEDIKKYLSLDEKLQFCNFLNKIRKGRAKEENKSPNAYWVVNQDEPYASIVIDLILLGEKAKVGQQDIATDIIFNPEICPDI